MDLRAAERTVVTITLDERRIAPGAALTGRVASPTPDPIEISLVATTTTPFGARSEIVTTIETQDPGFQLVAPWAPTSWRGELLTTEWAVHARTSSGATAIAPVEVRANRVTVESVDDDDLDGPPTPYDRKLPLLAGLGLVAGLAGVLTAFGTGHAALRYLAGFGVFFAIVALSRAVVVARQWAALGDVRCRVETVRDQLRCVVAAGRGDGPPDGTRVTATLLVVEIAASSRAGRGEHRREHVVLEHSVPLERTDDGTWRGSIPHAVANLAPLSWTGAEGAATSSISWTVRIGIDAPRAPHCSRVMPLVAQPTGIDANLRPRYVEIPRAAR